MIVFSDLDGTLLDHQSYDYAPALPTLTRLRRLNIPLILASSKTAAEMVPLRADLGFEACPMICENGAGAVMGASDRGKDQSDYTRLRAVLDALPVELKGGFEGFADMGPTRIAQVTGLSMAAAALASQRQFSEPGLWRGTQEQKARFQTAIAEHGITARRGGRFLTLSFGATKADQVEQIMARLGKSKMIALGDAPNDTEMLVMADHAIVLPNEHGTPPDVTGARDVIHAVAPGPVGWNHALGGLLTRLGFAE